MNINIEVSDITLDSVIDGFRVQTGEDEFREEPVTLRDAVIDRIAEKVVATHGRGYDIQTIVRDERNALIRERLAPIVEQALAAPLQRTNRYGEPQGSEVTMREVLVEEVRKVLDARVDSQGRATQYAGDGKQTYVQHLIRTAVADVIGKELKAEIDAAKAALKDQLRAAAAAKLAETVRL